MPQQINLCTPILLSQKRYFSAQTMAQALAIFVLVGGSLAAYWVWSLQVASEGFKTTLSAQALELESLRAALLPPKNTDRAADAALTQEVQARKAALQQREKLTTELQRGLFAPGEGHSARLALVARSIPPEVWVTLVKADEQQLELAGFTLEPAALNTWVRSLALSPLLQGQKLATVKVESASEARTAQATVPAAAPMASAPQRPLWSFSLVSMLPAAPVTAAVGARP